MEIYRTFIGVPVQVENEFLRARGEMMVRLSRERISWVDPDRYHVTIRFIGDTSPKLLEAIGDSLKTGLTVPAISGVRLGQVGSFGPRKKPRVVWLGFGEQTLFKALKTQVDGLLESCGIPAVDQPFTAHLTLGRIRSLRETDYFYTVVDSMKERFSGIVFPDQLVFYRSDLRKCGPLYTPLETLKFRAQVF